MTPLIIPRGTDQETLRRYQEEYENERQTCQDEKRQAVLDELIKLCCNLLDVVPETQPVDAYSVLGKLMEKRATERVKAPPQRNKTYT